MASQFQWGLHLKGRMKVDIAGQSQHYAGTAFDVGQRLSNLERNNMRNLAQNSGIWSYVELVTQIFKKI